MLRCTAITALLLLGCRPATSVEPEPLPAIEAAPAEPTTAAAIEPEVAAAIEPEPEPEPDVPASAISKDVIRAVVRSHLGGVRRCYDAALAVEPSGAGRVETSFTIGPRGAVIDVDLQVLEWPTSDITRELQACLSAEIQSWTFPAPEGGGNVVIRYPFVLVPNDAAASSERAAGSAT